MKAYFDNVRKDVPENIHDIFLEKEGTAVITIDMHEGHLSTDPDCPCPSPRGRQIIEPLNKFMEEARALNIPIIHAVLTSVRWDTSSYLIMAVRNILDGTPSKIPADYTGTLENGMIYLADINYSLLDSDTAEKVKNAVADAAAGFENGTKHVFCGPLYNQSGKELVKAGEVYIEPKSSPTFGEVLQGIDIKK